jgi:hypothetical protein
MMAGRKPSVPNIERVKTAITDGRYDEHLGDLQNWIKDRQQALKDDVLQHVRQVFGDEAQIVIQNGNNPPQPTSLNPFIQKAMTDDGEIITADPLEKLNGMNSLEREMEQVGRGGVIISGMSPSDMG